jgi:alkylation response protein AidB-like acyl-CoA dehydrogenase
MASGGQESLRAEGGETKLHPRLEVWNQPHGRPLRRRARSSDRRAASWPGGPDLSGAGRGVAVEGGIRVTGRWGFATGSRRATWLGAHVPVFEPDGSQRMNPNGRPHVRTVLFPKSKAEIIDNWQVIGLRGTGSDSYRVEDLFVPQKYTFSRDNPARSCWACCPREECSASGREAL